MLCQDSLSVELVTALAACTALRSTVRIHHRQLTAVFSESEPNMVRRSIILLLLGIPVVWMFWLAALLVPYIAPVLPRPVNVPASAKAFWESKGGEISWFTCVNVAGGSLSVRRSRSGSMLFGSVANACSGRPATGRPIDPEKPVFYVFDRRLSFLMPGEVSTASGPCPSQMSAEAINATEALLAQAQRIQILSSDEKSELALAASRELENLRGGGLDVSGYDGTLTCSPSRSE